MVERVDAETVSFQTAREHYGIWRWRIERESSNRLAKLWAEIGASSLDNGTQVELANGRLGLGIIREGIRRAARKYYAG